MDSPVQDPQPLVHIPAPEPAAPPTRPPVGVFMRRSGIVALGESVRKAIAVLRKSPYCVIPVLDGGRVVGMIDETCLRAAGDGLGAAQTAVETIMRHAMVTIPYHITADVALEIMRANNVDVLPVVDHESRFRGMVTRSDLLQAQAGWLPPERVGGMATPLGVYLTSGLSRGGVGDFALFLSGVALFGLLMLAWALVFAATWFFDPVSAISLALRGPSTELPWAWAAVAVTVGVLFRTSPLAAYHAAEHQVVNAIERGEDLTPERVSRMPRVHPRCGTNLVVVGMTATAVVLFLGGSPDVVVLAVIVSLVSRYTFGALAQQFVTTKRPGRTELVSGIRAAEQLIARHQSVAGRRVSLLQRIWSMGMVQVAAGLMIPMWVLSHILGALGIPVPF